MEKIRSFRRWCSQILTVLSFQTQIQHESADGAELDDKEKEL
jgi:hypothetical protein